MTSAISETGSRIGASSTITPATTSSGVTDSAMNAAETRSRRRSEHASTRRRQATASSSGKARALASNDRPAQQDVLDVDRELLHLLEGLVVELRHAHVAAVDLLGEDRRSAL